MPEHPNYPKFVRHALPLLDYIYHSVATRTTATFAAFSNGCTKCMILVGFLNLLLKSVY